MLNIFKKKSSCCTVKIEEVKETCCETPVNQGSPSEKESTSTDK